MRVLGLFFPVCVFECEWGRARGCFWCPLIKHLNIRLPKREKKGGKTEQTCDWGLLDWIKTGLAGVRGQWTSLWKHLMVNFPYFIPAFARGLLAPSAASHLWMKNLRSRTHVNTDQRARSRFYHRILSISVSFISFTDGQQIMFHTRVLWPCGTWGFELSLHALWRMSLNLRGSKCTQRLESRVGTRTNKGLINPQKGLKWHEKNKKANEIITAQDIHVNVAFTQ